jgi:alpha-glucoside transport system substrate-binding protein
MHQGSFMATFLRDELGQAPDTYDFLAFPDINTRFSGSVIAAGDLFGLVHDTPAARAVIRYLVTPEAQAIWVKRGGAISVNMQVRDYPDRESDRCAHLLADASVVRFDASDSMPSAMNAAFLRAVLDFSGSQSRLDDILASLEAVRATAYQ